MDRIRWSEKLIPFRSLVNNPAITKPVLVQIGSKAIVVGEKINGEFLMASPSKVSGDRFDVMEQEIVLSSKHTGFFFCTYKKTLSNSLILGVWRVISKATSSKEGHVHRLTTKDLERIHKQDILNERATPRSYICIRDVEAFELMIHSNDESVFNGHRVDRRMKLIEENVEFEIYDTSEVEYTPSEGERTSQDYVIAPKAKQATLLQLLLPGVVAQEQLIRNRVVRAIHCKTKGETRKRHFLLEVNEQPCEIRPIASDGSTELRYLHSTQNLYDYMSSYGNDTILYVKLLRGDPPMKAIEFDGYMVLKSTLNGDKIPICRVEDLEVTLVSADLPVKVRLPTRNEHIWRSLSEVRAAEIQCMQLSLALLARHESEMYVTTETPRNTKKYLESTYNQQLRTTNSHKSSNAIKKHIEECEKVFGNNNNNNNNNNITRQRSNPKDDLRAYQTTEKQVHNSQRHNSTQHNSTQQNSIQHNSTKHNSTHHNSTHHHHHHQHQQQPSSIPHDVLGKTMSHASHASSNKPSRTIDRRSTLREHTEQDESYNRFHRTTISKNPKPSASSSSQNHKTQKQM
ncbi:unnamed protein product [Rotaria sp. Silwood2]|nr:unnamed protein product [Rotaria sp. Silwood2]CAF2517794.1 unnamed protein product [Rotaria sp. Silwood2]CAF2969383.1 unnamed protein product [Rotaria sp. Silwood2]CAF4062593.1 unnamed protein product [Rotaria sp. Silwood2]CAF4393870.1 unnamed protein product [Rotaria sp. Silwood2]